MVSNDVIGIIGFDSKLETYFILERLSGTFHGERKHTPLYHFTSLYDPSDIRGRFSTTYVNRDIILDSQFTENSSRYRMVNANGILGPVGNHFHFTPIPYSDAKFLLRVDRARELLLERGRVYEDVNKLEWVVISVNAKEDTVLLRNRTKTSWLTKRLTGLTSIDKYREVSAIDLLNKFTFPKERKRKKQTVEI